MTDKRLNKILMSYIKKGKFITHFGCQFNDLAIDLIKNGFKEYIGVCNDKKKIKKLNKLKVRYKAWSFVFLLSDYSNIVHFCHKTDICIMTDFIEYIKNDIDIIKGLYKKADVVFTIKEKNEKYIRERYKKYLNIIKIDYYKSYYIVLAVKK